MSTNKFTRKHFHRSEKAIGVIHVDSSYELRLAVLLDDNKEVVSYKDHQCFYNEAGKKRIYDFLVHYKNGDIKLIEVKPKRRIEEFREQIEDNRLYAASQGWLFEIWSEAELGFKTEKEITAWADQYLLEREGVDYASARAERSLMRTKKHYRNKIATNTVTVYCDFCKEEHTALKLTYDRNMARNGRYICEREGGHIAGSKPKISQRKENPHAADGKKQCAGECKQVLLFEQFSPDKSKRDGLCSMCKECRSKKMKAAYDRKKAGNS